MFKRSKFHIIILLIVILLISIAYAVFTEQLEINGTVSGSANFKVYFTEATYENQTVTNPESQTFEITLNYEQNTVSPELEKVHTHASIPSGGGEEPPAEVAPWTQNGTSVTNGDVVLEVGQAVTGYEASGVTNWYVLGAEDGKLLLTTIYAPEKVTISGLNGCANGISILNEAAEKYNDGNLAFSARSINLNDINRVTGYNPEIDQVPIGDVSDYGSVVTYYWDGTDQIYYSSTNDYNGYLPEEYNTDFYYIEENEVLHSPKSTTATIDK